MSLKTNRNRSGSSTLTPFKKYRSLRNKIDKISLKLEEEHKGRIVCKPGCTQCCIDFSIFPVEFWSIVQETGNQNIIINQKTQKGKCPFLNNALCSVYESRPIICRTHGLPILFMGEDDWQLTYCELNFTGDDIPEFTGSNTFPQDLFNSKLFLINRDFISDFKEKEYKETDLISLKELGRAIGKKTFERGPL
jgi:uncharacterized protein